MRSLLLILMFIPTTFLFGQHEKIMGTVTGADGSPVANASIVIKNTLLGTTTNEKGTFSLSVGKLSLPRTLVVSSVNYAVTEVQVNSLSDPLSIKLTVQANVLHEVVTTASRVPENILQSPVSIEKMNLRAIRENPSLSFYDGLVNLKGVDAITSSLTYKQLNTRGFNSTGNPRFLQLIDGVDNQTPGLNFAVGNQFGTSDIDLESAEIIPGAASALYGPIAFNGVLSMRTKDPYRYQGLTIQAKAGINHIGESAVNPHALGDFAARYAKSFGRFAFKVNAAYLTGLDWYATNYTDISAQTPPAQRGDNNPGRDALNIYGDEVSRTISNIGLVSRTGYEEKDLMNYNVYSLKLNGALHYRITNNLEAVYQYNYNRGTASYTGSSRFDLNNFVLQTHRLELKGSKFFVRSYAVEENSHDSYNTRSLAQFINRDWVKDLNGNTVTPDKADDTWFTRYAAAYNGTISGVTAANHPAARAFADQGRFLPGTSAFDDSKDKSIHTYGLNGAGVFSNSKFYHTEGQYDFTSLTRAFELLAGGNFRYYNMFTNGSLFDDKDQKITIKEYGAFVQAGKKLFNDRLKLVASLRWDKNENFDGNFTPRFAAVYTANKIHNFRASFQTGFRNPTPVDQYIHLNVGPITILGGAPKNSDGMNVYQNSFTASSVGVYGQAFGHAMAQGKPFPQAVNENKDLLVKSNVPYIKPEQQKTFEVGYKGLIGNKALIDINYYYSSYTDFILNTVVIQPQHEIIGPDGKISFDAAADIPNGNVHAYQLYTNAPDKVSAQGLSIGITYMMSRGYTIAGNGTWSQFNLKNANPNNIPAFNTPPYATNLSFSNSNAFRNFGFNIAWHWQDAFDWYGTFTGNAPGRINAYSLVDLQVNKKLSGGNTMFKLGASNILNNKIYQAYGSPSIGAMYYFAVVVDGLFK